VLHRHLQRVSFLAATLLVASVTSAQDKEKLFLERLKVEPRPIKSEAAVRYDYDIAYVRAQRAGDKVHKRFFTDFSQPVTLEPGADLMLLHPDGTEEVLVEAGAGSITDPFVSYDGQWIYYAHLYNLEKHNQWSPPRQGSDIFKVHVKSRKIVRLTNQQFAPNTGAAAWSDDFRTPTPGKSHFDYGVFNMGPCPLPDGRLVFTSNREGIRPTKGYPVVALQLFVIDDADSDVDPREAYPRNIEKIGHLNGAGALHPVVLADGRIMFSTLESQGIRSEISWGIWTIHPDGTNWAPLVSAFDPGGASNGFHFQSQLSDGSIIVEEYYNQNNSGFGAYIKLPATPPADYPAFGPASMNDPRHKPWRFGRHDNGKGKYYRLPFMPTGSVSLTPFALNGEGPADPSLLGDKNSAKVGKVTHPSGAPDNHLLTAWSPGPANHQYSYLPQIDSGIYLIPKGEVIEEPAQMLLIKNDPQYNECWPRAVVPYQQIYGIPHPRVVPRLANDGTRSPLLPAGAPFGLVGTSSLYKRESYPNGVVPPGQVTAEYAGGKDPWKGLDAFTSHGNGMPINWHNQGADAGLYDNSQIHAVRILAMEPTTDRHRGARAGRLFHSHAMERLRILGEIPVRKIGAAKGGEPSASGGQPLDPDGNPDTSFLARIPADVMFTFQTIDRQGLVLNASQTWHQLRPGEVRHDCGGCHAHSQKPTLFKETYAARADYKVFDLTTESPLVTNKPLDQSRRQWDVDDRSGMRFERRPLSVEYRRDIQPILARSCTACHTRTSDSPAGNLVLDDDETQIQHDHHGKFPGTYYRLALDNRARYGHKPVGYDSWGYPQASRYVRMLQSRRSLLVWKLFGERLDGFSNDDHPSESKPGAGDLTQRGQSVDIGRFKAHLDLDYAGSIMPPADAVAAGKVEPLSDEDRRTIVRWIDLGCPLDRDTEANESTQSLGWHLDDTRPTLALESPRPGINRQAVDSLVIGLHDFGSGIDDTSLQVIADFEVAGIPPGKDLSARFVSDSPGVMKLTLDRPLPVMPRAKITIAVRDRQGNESRIVRTFSVAKRE